jgi:LCP family protein required for cell wall assembly
VGATDEINEDAVDEVDDVSALSIAASGSDDDDTRNSVPQWETDADHVDATPQPPDTAYLSDGSELSPAQIAKLSRRATTASKIAHWFGRGLAIVLLASVALTAVLAVVTGFIPTLWLVAGCAFATLIAGGITYGLFATRPQIHRKTYTGLSIGAVIGIVLSLFASTFLNRIYDFTDAIQPNQGTAITYAVFALKSSQLGPSPYTPPTTPSIDPDSDDDEDSEDDGNDDEADTDDETASPTPTTATPSASASPTQTGSVTEPETPFDAQILLDAGVGQLINDPNHDAVAARLKEIVPTVLVDYQAPTELAVGLNESEVIAGIVDSSVLGLYKEHTPEFYESIEVLFTFDIYVQAKPATGGANDTTGPFVLFISGIDTWGDLDESGLSDVNMLVVVNPNTGKMLLVNTPRDYYVPLRDHPGTPDKLTHAAAYGIETSVGTIEDLYEVEVDYWLRINFNSVMSIVQELGGIEVEVTDEFTCGYGYMPNQFTFYPGWQHLDGEQALCFARERKSLEGGDRDRGKHQQQIIAGIMDKVTSPSILLSYGDVLSALGTHLETSMPANQITAFARLQLERGIRWSIDEVSADGYDAYAPTYTYGGQELYVMKPIISSVDEAKSRIEVVLQGR